jgi:uncharacterized protein involved in exopolysaccharide biosynthesis
MLDKTESPAAADGESLRPVTARELFGFFWRHKLLICATAAICAAAAFVIASNLTRKYRAVVVMVPSEAIESDSGGGLASQLGGLAQIAGIPVSGNSKRNEAYEILHSRTFARHFIETNNLAPLLFPKRWDSGTQQWRSTGRGAPSAAELVEAFNSKVSAVSQDKVAGTIQVSVTWPDRTVAANWANALVTMANDQLRERHMNDAAQMVDYLNKQLERTQATEVRSVLYTLMESELRKSAIANVSHEYAFKVVDPAMVPDQRDWVTPNRPVYAIIGGLIGIMGAAIVGYRRDLRPRSEPVK